MNKQTNILLGAVVVALIAVSVYFQSSVKSLDTKLNMLLSQSAPSGGKGDGGKQRDLYKEQAVNNTILKRAVDIQAAYNVYLKGNPEITDGEVKVDFQIGPDGKTISPEIISSAFTDKKFKEDIVKAISGWVFPPPPFGTAKYIVHTFKLSKSK